MNAALRSMLSTRSITCFSEQFRGPASVEVVVPRTPIDPYDPRAELDNLIVKHEMWLTRTRLALERLRCITQTRHKRALREMLLAREQALIIQLDRWMEIRPLLMDPKGEHGPAHAFRSFENSTL